MTVLKHGTQQNARHRERLNMPDVVAVCNELHIGYLAGPRGVNLNSGRAEGGRYVYFRIETTSGIGAAHGWRLVTKLGEPRSPVCYTRRQLRRALLEHLAGPKPPGAAYAKRHRNRFGDSVVWVRESVSRPRSTA